jgi:CHAD domain-containing protein
MELDVITFAGPSSELRDTIAALEARGFRFEAPHAEARTVLDSFDGRLAEVGLRLERHDGPAAELVLRGDQAVAAHMPVAATVRFAGDLPPGPFRARLLDVLEVRALAPQLTVSSTARRGEWRDGSDKVVATVTLRQRLTCTPPAGDGDALPAVTIEVETLAGYDKRSRQAADVLEDAGWQRLEQDTVDVAAAAAGVDFAGFRSSPTVPLEGRTPAIDGVRRVLANLAVAIDANWQGTIDATDPEFLHDLRVAVRRTRSVLAESRTVLPTAIGAEARDRFRWLGQATGPARDLDVYVIEWPTYTAGLDRRARDDLGPALELLCRHRDDAQGALVSLLRSDEAMSWMQRWRTWLDGPVIDVDQGPDQHLLLGDHVVKKIKKSHRTLVANGRQIHPESPAELLHDLRKDAKRLRYLLECFGSVLPKKRREAFVSRLKALQKNLGEHQDAEVHIHHLRVISHELHVAGAATGTLVAIGQLAEQLDRMRHAARAEFAEQFASYDSKDTERALTEMLDGVDR